jgi:hypothetical protein
LEKRQHKRCTSRCEIEFSMNGYTYRGISSNLSLNGLFIRTRKPFTADTVISLIVYFPNGSTSKLKGITKHAVRNLAHNQINGMGIEIIEKDSNYFDFINSIVSQHE